MTYTPPDFDAWETSIDSAIARKIAGADVVSYSMQGVSFQKTSLDDLFKAKDMVRALRDRFSYGNTAVVDNSGEA